MAGEVPTPPEWPTLYQIVLDRNNDPSDNDNRPDAGVFNGDLIYVVEFYPEVGYWELRRFDYDAQTVTWDEIPTEGTFSIEANFVCISIPESEIKLTSTQEALPFRVVTETETHETLFWDAAPDEDRAVLPIIPPADTETK